MKRLGVWSGATSTILVASALAVPASAHDGAPYVDWTDTTPQTGSAVALFTTNQSARFDNFWLNGI